MNTYRILSFSPASDRRDEGGQSPRVHASPVHACAVHEWRKKLTLRHQANADQELRRRSSELIELSQSGEQVARENPTDEKRRFN